MARSGTVTSRTPPGTAAPRRKVPRRVRERQMLEVAEGAGISKSMVYAYFGSKEGLYRACMARARQRLFDALQRGADAGAAPDEQLWLGLLAFFTFVEEQRDSWAVLLGEVTAGAGPFAAEGAEVRREIAGLVGDLLREAAAAEGIEPAAHAIVEPLARALIGAGESLAVWWAEHPDEPAERVALVLMNFAWNGLGGLVQGRAWSPPR